VVEISLGVVGVVVIPVGEVGVVEISLGVVGVVVIPVGEVG
jgi:hypothetical protein